MAENRQQAAGSAVLFCERDHGRAEVTLAWGAGYPLPELPRCPACGADMELASPEPVATAPEPGPRPRIGVDDQGAAQVLPAAE